MEIKKLNKQLNDGILPDSLNYTKQEYNNVIDWEKVKYNAFYRSYGFYESKFPKGHESIPGFDKIIQSIVEKAEEQEITPLKELERIINYENQSEEDLKIEEDKN
jgi:hypothetical protein